MSYLQTFCKIVLKILFPTPTLFQRLTLYADDKIEDYCVDSDVNENASEYKLQLISSSKCSILCMSYTEWYARRS